MSNESKKTAFDKSIKDPLFEAARQIDEKLQSVEMPRDKKTEKLKDLFDSYLLTGEIIEN